MKCFYHSADLDGHCSGAIIKNRYPECEMIGINYGDPFSWDTIQENETVFMVDFSLQPFDDMVKLQCRCNLIWIDHHISAIKERDRSSHEIQGCQRTNQAACELTWLYCYGVNMPFSVSLLGRYDVWDLKAHEDIMPFQYGMRIFETRPENSMHLWEKIFFNQDFIQEVTDNGILLLKYQNSDNKKYVQACAFETEFEGLRAIAVNKGLTSSTLFDSIWDESQYDIMITFVRREEKWTVSLYSTKKDIDVSEIAKKHGGGGHKSAAGFQTTTLFFI